MPVCAARQQGRARGGRGVLVEERIHVWLTNRALTHGICEGDVMREGHSRRVSLVTIQGKPYLYLGPKDWHLTHAKAVAQAEKMRQRKIASLEKQLTKLRAMKFE